MFVNAFICFSIFVDLHLGLRIVCFQKSCIFSNGVLFNIQPVQILLSYAYRNQFEEGINQENRTSQDNRDDPGSDLNFGSLKDWPSYPSETS